MCHLHALAPRKRRQRQSLHAESYACIFMSTRRIPLFKQPKTRDHHPRIVWKPDPTPSNASSSNNIEPSFCLVLIVGSRVCSSHEFGINSVVHCSVHIHKTDCKHRGSEVAPSSYNSTMSVCFGHTESSTSWNTTGALELEHMCACVSIEGHARARVTEEFSFGLRNEGGGGGG